MPSNLLCHRYYFLTPRRSTTYRQKIVTPHRSLSRYESYHHRKARTLESNYLDEIRGKARFFMER